MEIYLACGVSLDSRWVTGLMFGLYLWANKFVLPTKTTILSELGESNTQQFVTCSMYLAQKKVEIFMTF